MSELRERHRIRDKQSQKLRQLLRSLGASDCFYRRKFAAAGIDPDSIHDVEDLHRLPLTCKNELVTDQSDHPPLGSVSTLPPEHYSRLHQTSGTTTGQPLRWPDTPASWDWLLGCWRSGFELMRLTPVDRAYFPFSFGPFLGFWTAFEAASRFGMLCLPGGGLGSSARLRAIVDNRATVVFTTPSYALHLAELAVKEGLDLAASDVRALVLAGEPGGGMPATRARIETTWGARVFDHYGMTEIGPVAFEAENDPGNMVVLEEEYIAEILEPGGTSTTSPGDVGELVLTNLGRFGSPLIRYRTGDLVRQARNGHESGQIRLEGGVLGRCDDMIHVRGNNLYPTAIESVIRRFPGIVEFRLLLDQRGPLADLGIEVEPSDPDTGPVLADAVARAIRDELLFRVAVTAVPPGTLPRFEMKARRLVRVQHPPSA